MKETEKTDNEQQRINFENDVCTDALQEFILNSTPSALSKYLRYGGIVDDQVREILISILEKLPGGNPGGSKPWRDYQTYVGIQYLMFMDRCQKLCSENSDTKKTRSLRDATIEFAKSSNQELRTVEKQYKRGEDLFSKTANK